MVDKKVGSAGIEITVDDSAAMKVFKNIFNSVGKVDDVMKKFGETLSFTITKTEELGTKTSKSAKGMVDTFNEIKKTMDSSSKMIESINKSLDSQSKNTINNFKKTGEGIKDVNKTLSDDTKQTFEGMRTSYDGYNKNLLATVKYSAGEFKSSFIELKDSVVGLFKNIGSAIISSVKKPVEVIQSIPDAAKAMGQKVTGFFASGFSQAKDLALSQLDKVQKGISAIPKNARNASDKTKEFFVTGFNSMTLGASSAMSKTARFINDLPNRTRQSATNLKTNFVQKIKDIPKSASEMVSNVKDKFTGMSGSAKSTGGKVKTFFSDSFSRVKESAKESIEKSKNKIKELDGASDKASISIGKIASAFGLLKVATKVVGMVTNSIGSAINRLDTLNNSSRAFENMGFSAKETEAAISGLEKGIKGLPTPLDEAITGLQMISASTQDVGKSQKIFNALNDSILGFNGTTEQVSNATLQLSQAFSDGKISGDTWNSMMTSNMGPTLNAMAKMMGKTTGELKSGLSEGTISVAEFQDALITLDTKGGGGLKSLNQIALDSTKGIKTSFVNMRSAINRGTAKIVEGIDKGLQRAGFKTISESITSVGSVFEKVLGGIGQMIPGVIGIISQLAKPFTDLIPVVGATGKVVFSFFDGLYSQDFSKFSEPLNDLREQLYKLFPKDVADGFINGLVAALQTIGDFSKGVIGITKIVTGSISSFDELDEYLAGSFGAKGTENIMKIGNAIKDVFADIKTVAMTSFSIVSSLVSGLIDVFSAFFSIISGGGAEGIASTSGNIVSVFQVLEDVVKNKVTPALFAFSDWMLAHQGTVKTLTAIILGLVAGFQAMKVVGTVSKMLLGLGKAVSAVKIAFVSLSNLGLGGTIKMLLGFANPITLVIAGIAALVTAVVYLWKTNEDFRNAVTTIWHGIVQVFKGAWDNIKEVWSGFTDFFTNLWSSIIGGVDGAVNDVKNSWQGMKEWFSNLWSGIVTIFLDSVQGIKDGWQGIADWFVSLGQTIKTVISAGILTIVGLITNHFSGAIEGIKTMFTGLVAIFENVFTLIKNVIMGPILLLIDLVTGDFEGFKTDLVAILQNLSGAISGIFQGIVTFTTGYFQMLFNVIATVVTGIKDKVIEIFTAIWNWIVESWNTAIETVVNLVTQFANSIVNGFINMKDSVVQKVHELRDGVINAFNWLLTELPRKVVELKNSIIQKAVEIKDGFINKIVELKDGVVNKFTEIKDNIVNTVSSIDLTEIAKNIMDGLVKGITDKIDAVKDAVGKVTDGVKGWFKDKLDIHSPSRVMAKLSQWIPVGVAKGITDKVGTVKSAVQGMGSVVSKTFDSAQTVINVADPIINNQPEVPDIQPDISLGDSFTDSLSVDVPKVFSVGSDLGSAVSEGIDSTAVKTNQSGNQLMTLLKTALTNYLPQMTQTGKGLLQSVINGFNSLFGMAQTRAFNIGQLMVANVNKHQNNMRNAGLSLMNSLATGIRNGQVSVERAIRSINGGMLNGISKGINGVLNGVNFVLTEVGSEKKLPTWKIPAYAKGTDGHPHDGPALVNDARDSNWQEGYQMPDGRVGLFPRIKNLIANLPKGAKVFSGRSIAKMNGLPAYKDGIGDFDITDLLDGPNAFSEFVSKQTDFSGIKEPWLNMSKSASKLMTGEAYGMVKTEMDKFFTHGTFDGALNANGVYQYLVDVAQSLISKFPGLTVTSGYRPGDPYYHGKRQALDLAYPGVTNDSKYRTIADYAFNKFPKQIGYVITLGRVRDRLGLSGTGSSGSWVNWPDNDHFDHIHLNGAMGSGDIFTGGDSSTGGSNRNWSGSIKKAAAIMGQKVSSSQVNGILAQIQRESGGNERITQSSAVWDVNMANGNPAQGLLQYIPQTFNAYKMRGYENILNGLHQLVAFFNNSNWVNDIQYGRSGWGPRGHRIKAYANGGLITKDGLYRAGEGDKAEMVLPLTKPKRALELIVQSLKYMGISGMDAFSNIPNIANNLMSNMTDKMDNVKNFSMDNVFDAMQAQIGAVSINILGEGISNSQSVDLSEVISLLREIAQGVANGTVVLMDGKRISKATSTYTDKELAKRSKLEERGLAID